MTETVWKLADVVRDQARSRGASPALIFEERVTTYKALDQHTSQIANGLIAAGVRRQARVAILDITGVPVVDTQVAKALIIAAQGVRLLGAQVVLTGIRPEVAQTLVGLGIDLNDVIIRSTLQSGIAYATR